MKKMRWGEDPEFSGPRNWFRESLIIKEVMRNKKNGKILDFGCGSGTLLIRLAQKGFKGMGVDISSSAIDFFSGQIRKNKLVNLHALRIDSRKFFSDTKLKDNFDIIVCGETLEHLKNDKHIVKEFYRVLKNGGICVVSVPARMDLWDINDNFSSHYRRYEKKDLEQLFIDNGFLVKDVYYWGFPLSFYWHKYIYLPLIKKKMHQNKTYSRTPRIIGNTALAYCF